MKCREFTEFIADYLNGELLDDVRQAFERHISRCEACRAYLSNYLDTIRLGREALADQDADIPADVPEDLIRAILAARPR